MNGCICTNVPVSPTDSLQINVSVTPTRGAGKMKMACTLENDFESAV